MQRQVALGTPFMLDNAMIRLTLDVISESSFGVNFNTMDNLDNNMGDFYLEENELFLKEVTKSILNPFRKFMFWDDERKRAQAAKNNLMKLAQNLVDSYRDTNARKGKNAEDAAADGDTTIMGRLMSCEYANDESRAQDVLMMLLGGHGECWYIGGSMYVHM